MAGSGKHRLDAKEQDTPTSTVCEVHVVASVPMDGIPLTSIHSNRCPGTPAFSEPFISYFWYIFSVSQITQNLWGWDIKETHVKKI